jgi:hypothetical protein
MGTWLRPSRSQLTSKYHFTLIFPHNNSRGFGVLGLFLVHIKLTLQSQGRSVLLKDVIDVLRRQELTALHDRDLCPEPLGLDLNLRQNIKCYDEDLRGSLPA